jgi:tetratricopeptide (TPR) repeat protein
MGTFRANVKSRPASFRSTKSSLPGGGADIRLPLTGKTLALNPSASAPAPAPSSFAWNVYDHDLSNVVDINDRAVEAYVGGQYGHALDLFWEANSQHDRAVVRERRASLLAGASCAAVVAAASSSPLSSSSSGLRKRSLRSSGLFRSVAKKLSIRGGAEDQLSFRKKVLRRSGSSLHRVAPMEVEFPWQESARVDASTVAALLESENSEGKDIKSTYIYQRMDFDEGMHAYPTCEMLSVDHGRNVVSGTLYFNVGQCHRQSENFEQAAHFYRKSWKALVGDMIVDDEEKDEYLIKIRCAKLPALALHILQNIGQLQYRLGKIADAIKTYEAFLHHAEEAHGSNDIIVGAALNSLGVLHYHLCSDHSSKAMGLFRRSLAIRTAVHGRNHPEVATTLNNMGRIHVQRDEFEEALKYYEEALEIRRARLGLDSLDYAATAFNAGQSFHQRNKLDRALELYREFLRVARSKFSGNHRDVAVVLSGIAQIHQERGEHDEALKLYGKSQFMCKRPFTSTFEILSHIFVFSLAMLSKNHVAEESLQVGRAALGTYHSEIAMLLNRIGNFHFEREDLDSAIRAYHEGLEIERKVLEPDHPNIIVTLSNLGEIHRQRSEWRAAIRLYEQALELQKKKFGAESADVATTINTMGLIYDQKGDTSKALRFLQDALVLRRKVLDKNDLDLSATLTYVGTILYRRNMLSLAMDLFQESLQIRTSALGPDHRDVAFTMYNCGLVHQQRGTYAEAIDCYKETLRVEKLVLGDEHRDVAMTLFKLGEAYKAEGDDQNALQSFQSALEIERKTLGESDPATIARTLNEIGNIHLTRGDVIPMMEAFNEASRIYRSAGLSANNVTVSGQLYAFDISCPEAAPAA